LKSLGQPLKTPIYHPVRLRIYTQDELLAELPWQATRWQNQPLVSNGWTFELAAHSPEEHSPRYQVDLQTPFPILLLAPPDDPHLGWEMHKRDVEQKLRDTWRVTFGFVHTAGDQAALDTLRRQSGQPPHLIYYYGPAVRQNGTLCIQLNAPGGLSEWCPVESLVQGWGRGGVKAIFLNLVQEEPLYLGTTLAKCSRQVPLVISQAVGREASRQAQETFIAWLHELLNGAAPLQTLHEKGYSTAASWRNFDHWHLDARGRDGIPMELLGHLLLDRTEERALVNRAVDELIAKDKRLTCIIAYAEAGNRVDLLFSAQARDYLMRHARDKVSVEVFPISCLTDNPPDSMAFERAVRRAFGIADASLDKGLSRALEQVRNTRFAGKLRGNARPLLLLDWQVWTTTPKSPIEPGLRDWMTFNQRWLCTACPKNLHLLSCLALESGEVQHNSIRDVIETMRSDRDIRRDRAFYLEKTAHLHHVSQDELVDFFSENRDALHCANNEDLCFELAEIIYHKTNGQYEAILGYLEQRQNTSWETLCTRWQQE
jgi:hypothetical protein